MFCFYLMSLNDVFELVGLLLLHVRNNVHNWSGQRVVLQGRMRNALSHTENITYSELGEPSVTKSTKYIYNESYYIFKFTDHST